MASLAVLCTLLLLAVFIQHGESLRCWACSSDTEQFCQDPFQVAQSQYSSRFTLMNCEANGNPNIYSGFGNSKPVCKKQKYYNSGGQMVTVRSCTWKSANDYSSTCPNNRGENSAYCETCEHDGCNSASTSSYFLALLAAPLGLVLFK